MTAGICSPTAASTTITICAAGLTGDVRDPRFFNRARKHAARIPVRCKTINVVTESRPLELRLRVTPMPRLPDE